MTTDTVAIATTYTAIDSVQENVWRQEGRMARQSGLSIGENPYPPSSDAYCFWDDGWRGVDSGGFIDIREVTQAFVRQRMANTSSVEQIRAKALNKLAAKLDDEDAKFSPAALLNIVDTLNNSSKDDMALLMKAQSGDGKTGASAGNYYNIFMSNNDQGGQPSAPPQLSSKQFGIIEKLVVVAETIVNAQQ